MDIDVLMPYIYAAIGLAIFAFIWYGVFRNRKPKVETDKGDPKIISFFIPWWYNDVNYKPIAEALADTKWDAVLVLLACSWRGYGIYKTRIRKDLDYYDIRNDWMQPPINPDLKKLKFKRIPATYELVVDKLSFEQSVFCGKNRRVVLNKEQ